MVEDQLKKAKPRQVEENNINMVIGLGGIFDYRIEEINPKHYDINDLIYKNPGVKEAISNVERGFEDANKFLEYLLKHGMSSGMHRFRVGKQDLIISFRERIEPGVMWWMYLDQWLYASDSYLKCFNPIKY